MPRKLKPVPTLSSPGRLLLWIALALTGCTLPMPTSVEEGAAPSPAVEETAGAAVSGRGGALAVLLPERGYFARAAKAVRAGVSAAHRVAASGGRIHLRFYDSTNAQNAPAILSRAVADGATMILGPLQRQAVERLAGEPSLPATTLALNRTTSGRIPPPDLYQFSLAPEDEAEEVARRALARGYSSALMIYPDNTWGLRVARAFREAWEGLGGVLEAGHPYGPEAYDLSEPLDKLFQMAEYGMDAQGHGTMADFVFLVGTAEQVREIWPQIRQRVGGRLPVFCTSHVNDGRSDGIRVQELAGIYFVDIPWMTTALRGEDLSLKRFRTGSRRLHHDDQRLFAMGVDAYRLLPLVGKAPTRTKYVLRGFTGALWIDGERRIRRELALSRIGGVDHP